MKNRVADGKAWNVRDLAVNGAKTPSAGGGPGVGTELAFGLGFASGVGLASMLCAELSVDVSMKVGTTGVINMLAGVRGEAERVKAGVVTSVDSWRLTLGMNQPS
jgi:hypothetical protein